MFSVSLYKHDVGQLQAFIEKAKTYADSQNEDFLGISMDIDNDGFITVYAAGLEDLKL